MSDTVAELNIEKLALALINNDIDMPEGWEKTAQARRLAWRPSHSDLVFNYLDCAIRCDRPEDDDKAADDAPETKIAIDLLSGILEIDPEDIAYHFLSRR